MCVRYPAYEYDKPAYAIKFMYSNMARAMTIR